MTTFAALRASREPGRVESEENQSHRRSSEGAGSQTCHGTGSFKFCVGFDLCGLIYGQNADNCLMKGILRVGERPPASTTRRYQK